MMSSSWEKCAFVIGMICVIGVVAGGSQHDTVNVDALAQTYLDAERNLWLLVRSTNVYDNDNALIHLYDTHEELLAKRFGETGIFDRLLTEQRFQYVEENRIMERRTWHMVESIKYINITAKSAQRLLIHRQYDRLPTEMADILEIMPKMIGTLRQYVTKQFWSYVRFVSIINGHRRSIACFVPTTDAQ